ncbi:SNARE-like domain protein [Leptospira inadai serovar Lyme str. 10]|uniref:SNARE-like domain protein n=2 Tax=Leptospira inadai serovar Lyme TaxID=293084 RepID=V6HNS7_9LEPT|nr:VTT domain-containing protein [Leptospira inadai]EQA38525.1 SNARE-like domain protein [Leptospira inadai serovar Lyme str. 10]PNV75208.1 DedA family protein [Leptospira inadai serovar Lyme]
MTRKTTETHGSSEKVLGRLLRQTLIASVVLFVGVIILARFFHEPVLQVSKAFIDFTGPFGVGIAILIADSVHIFFPPDTFLIIAVAAGLPDVWVISSASIGSLIAGCCSYAQGKYLLPKLDSFTRFLRTHEEKLEVYVKRFGFWAVVLGALTPLPYSWTSVAAGAMGMKFRIFLLAALFRIPRFYIYYYLIKGGWIAV